MQHGSLQVEGNSIPTFAPPYPNITNRFNDITVVSINYRVTAASIKHLVPSQLQLEDEPRVMTLFLHYGMSTVGSYGEFVHQVEVTYQGKKYEYPIVLVLDNEAAIFAGREVWGYPKVFGTVEIKENNGGRCVLGSVDRPSGNQVASFEFVPEAPTDPKAFVASAGEVTSINLRIIPSPVRGADSSVRDFVPARIRFTEMKNVMLGNGSIKFAGTSAINPWAGPEILRYEGAFLATGASAVLDDAEDVYPF
ncbi:hypothetical protein KC345_g972 [Hortaea werneckii]|nr:hypothetical protein KC345_g972 [Hortaea werneckii]